MTTAINRPAYFGVPDGDDGTGAGWDGFDAGWHGGQRGRRQQDGLGHRGSRHAARCGVGHIPRRSEHRCRARTSSTALARRPPARRRPNRHRQAPAVPRASGASNEAPDAVRGDGAGGAELGTVGLEAVLTPLSGARETRGSSHRRPNRGPGHPRCDRSGRRPSTQPPSSCSSPGACAGGVTVGRPRRLGSPAPHRPSGAGVELRAPVLVPRTVRVDRVSSSIWSALATFLRMRTVPVRSSFTSTTFLSSRMVPVCPELAARRVA